VNIISKIRSKGGFMSEIQPGFAGLPVPPRLEGRGFLRDLR